MSKRKLLFLFLVVALMALPVGSVYAQATNFNSGIQLQNLDASAADVQIIAYNKDGSEAANVSDTIPASGSKTYFPLDKLPTDTPQAGLGITGSFDGSVVVSSSKNVAAISNLLATSPGGISVGASYGSASAGSSSVTLPLIMRGNGGFDTSFNVQSTNAAGAGDVSVTVTYTPGAHGNTGCTETATIKPGAAVTFDQRTNSCLGTRFVGSASIAATGGDIVSTALEVGQTTLFAYNGFTGGSTNIVMPLINQNNSGFRTGVGIANVGSSPTDVTVSYTPSVAGTACTETKTVPAGGSANFSFNAFVASETGETCADGARFVGSAQVTANSASQPLVAIVNQLNSGTNKGAAYNAFDPANATNTVNFPLIMDNNGGAKFFTGMSVANVGADAVNITCTYSAAKSNASYTPAASSTTGLASGAAYAVNHNGLLRENASQPYVGSAACVATGSGETKIVGTVNELAAVSSGDQFLVYEGFNTN